MTESAMKLLTKIGKECSLRYSIHLITTSNLVAQKRKSAEVDIADIRKVYSLFVDVKRSTQFLKEFEQEFMFSDGVDSAANALAPNRPGADAEMQNVD